MRHQELTRYRELLQAQLAALTAHAVAPVPALEESAQELPDPNDRATREAEIEAELRMRERDLSLIPQLQQALARIDAGTFGQCVSCGDPIDPARLRARPVTALCIDCMRDAEQPARAG